MDFKRIRKWYDMAGRTVLLTGATGRLGRYYAGVMSEVGANVVIIDLDQAVCEEFAQEIRDEHGTDPLPLAFDVSDQKQVKDNTSIIYERYGRLDVLVNNACAYQTTIVDDQVVTFENFPLDLWQANLDVNLTGAFLLAQASGRRMIEDGGGVILNIGSTYGVVACDQRIYGDTGINSSVAYATTKSGLTNFSRYLASYYQGKNIRVNCLSPAGIWNDQKEPFLSNYLDKLMIKRMGNLDDLGAAVLYLVSDASSWVTGTNMMVDGGFTAW